MLDLQVVIVIKKWKYLGLLENMNSIIENDIALGHIICFLLRGSHCPSDLSKL